MIGALRRAGRRCVGWLYPEKCAFCGELMGENPGLICLRCAKSVRSPTVYETGGGGMEYDSAAAPFHYEKRVKRALCRLKFSGDPSPAEVLAAFMLSTAYAQRYTDADVVTWVPSSGAIARRRGYEQAALLARCMCRRSDGALPRPVRLLKKVRKTRHQHEFDRADRAKNVRNVFAVASWRAIEGKRILLVDDILTTGATASECARVLKAAGAARVDVLTAARTPAGKDDRPEGQIKKY